MENRSGPSDVKRQRRLTRDALPAVKLLLKDCTKEGPAVATLEKLLSSEEDQKVLAHLEETSRRMRQTATGDSSGSGSESAESLKAFRDRRVSPQREWAHRRAKRMLDAA